MRAQCEIMIVDILPAVRSILAEELKKRGMTQAQIADRLGITQPAVSQYLKKARGKNIESLRKDKKVMKVINEEVEHMMKHKKDDKSFCPMCQKMLDTDFVKKVCSGKGCLCK